MHFSVFPPKISKISNKNFKKCVSSASSACETKTFFIFEKSKMRRYHFIPQVLKSEQKPWRTRVLKKVAKRGGETGRHFRNRPHHLWVESHMPKKHLFTSFWRHFDALAAKHVDILTPWGIRLQFKYHEHLR